MRIFKTSLMLSVSSAILLTSLPAAAQLEEIIVTARQRSETLRDVPASITAITAQTIANAGIARAEDFVALTPGVTMVNTAEVGDTQVNIRGINGARDAENSFGLIIDGVLMTNLAAFNREYSDLQQIEILKGPQGALYGRNAAAGAIIVTTSKPSNERENQIKVGAADNKTFTTMVATSGPLVEDKAYYKLQADWRRTDGFFKNTFLNNKSVDNYEGYNINGRLVFEASDATTFDLKARWGQIDTSSIAFNAAFALPGFAAFLGNPDLNENVNNHKFVFEPNIDPENDQDALEISAKVDHEYSAGTLTGWVLYSDIKNDFTADGTSGAFGFFNQDATCRTSVAQLSAAGYRLPSPQFLAPTPEASFLGPYTATACDGTQYQVRNQEDISAEIRFTSPGDQDLRWIIGAYGLHINREVGVNLGIDRGRGVIEQLYLPANSLNPTEALVHDRFKSDVFAVFGSLAYDLQENTELSVALRYDRERRKVENLVPRTARTQYVDFTNDGVSSGGAFLNPGLDPTINPAGILPQKKATFDELEPKISISHDATDDVTVYANWGIGFKAGGFNNQGSAATVAAFFNSAPVNAGIGIRDDFDEETSSAFEVGFKSQFLDDSVTIDGAAYHNTVKGMQFFEFLVGPFGLLRVVNNIDKIRLYGGELSINAQVNDVWSIYAGGNVVDSKIKRMVSRPDTVGNKSPYTADYTINFGTQLDAPVTDSFNLLARADFTVVGPTWFHVVQCQARPTLFGVPSDGCGQRRDTYSTVDLRVGVQGDAWSVTAFAKNLTNSRHLAEVIPAPEFGGSFIHPAARRLVGVDASLKF